MPFELRSPNAIAPAHTLMAFLCAVIVGASRFAHTDWLRWTRRFTPCWGSPVFLALTRSAISLPDLPKALSSLSGDRSGDGFCHLFVAPQEGFSLDLDSTIFQRSGEQEGAAKGYNPHRPGRKSHHPLLAVLAEAPCVLHGWLRSGNTGACRGISSFSRRRSRSCRKAGSCEPCGLIPAFSPRNFWSFWKIALLPT